MKLFNLLKRKISEVEEKTKAFLKGEVILDDKKLDELFSGFEIALLESDVALEVSEKIIADLKESLHGRKIKQGEVENLIRQSLRSSLREIFPPKPAKLVELVRSKKPYVIAFVGVNG
ncbi:MAG: signal recognition particle receptor subunit alpha, partial [Euryarchaeota archaeon]|nr:signal recognition particle receptor subunit alpha [Euryarchaeota archaeon]